ncbi:MAG: DNA polymerase III subunit epsilon [Pseudomonadota bacterium]|nr:DNA polymerase III subunit epsilon [Pseudomonadota bacterium]
MRQIVLDTETTGLETSQGHRIIEIGCVEMVDRKLTGRTYHQYLNPDRLVDAEAIEVHGITNERLADEPRFREIVDDFLQFIEGAQLVIHNAPFDVGFMDYELQLHGRVERIEQICTVFDSLVYARKKHPGQKNNLDVLCNRYMINNDNRVFHGALLDAEILANVYLAMTGGQISMGLAEQASAQDMSNRGLSQRDASWVFASSQASPDELAAHDDFLALLNKKSDGQCLYLSDEKSAADEE